MILGGTLGGFGSAVNANVNGCDLEVTTNKLDIFNDGSCIACYNLDGDATDLSGNYDGTETDGVTYKDGVYNNGAHFPDNNSDSINIDTKIIDSTNVYSVSAWVRLTDNGTFGILTQNTEGWHKYGLEFIGDDNNIDFSHIRSDATKSNNLVSTPQITDGAWHNYVAVRDGKSIQLFQDGILVDTNTLVIDEKDNYANSYIGNYINGNDNTQVQNSLDQVRIFNKALTADEVYKLYKENEVCKLPTTNGLVAHYPLTGTAEDTTGNYNGTENGGLLYVDDPDMGAVANFDGSNDYVDISTIVSSTYNGFTISMWTKLTNTSNNTLLSYGDSAGKNVLLLHPRDISHYEVSTSPSFSTDIIDGKVHNYTAIVSADAHITVYIDGVLMLSKWSSTVSLNSSMKVYIGTDKLDSGSLTAAIKGDISNTRIYNRALTQEEITNIYLYEKNHRDVAVSNGLIAYYPLHNNSLDNYFNQYDGADNGNVSYDGLCLSSPTQGDYVDCGSGLANNVLTGSNVLTMCAWFKFSDMSTLAGRQFQIQAAETDGGIAIMYNGDIGKIAANSGGGGGNKAGAAIDSTLENNTWYHILITSDGDGTAIYLNGVLENTDATVMYDIKTNDLTKMLGDTSYNNDQRYCSNARIYNRVISEQEVNDIYNTEKSQFGL